MPISGGLQQQLQETIEAVEDWRAAKETALRAEADYLKRIPFGVEPVVQDVVEAAAAEATALLNEVLGG